MRNLSKMIIEDDMVAGGQLSLEAVIFWTRSTILRLATPRLTPIEVLILVLSW